MFLDIYEKGKSLMQKNCRQETRRYFIDKLVSCRMSLIGPWGPAQLRDISESGLGLIVPKEMQPEVGQEFDVFQKETNQRNHCHVLRTAPWENNQILVASRISYTGPCL
ncbi:PilZ domain-containing protein [Planctomycetota bacterium]